MQDVRLSDLFLPCINCNGTGRYECSGMMTRGIDVPTPGGSGTCPACAGTGGRLTPQGETLLRFMQIMKEKGWL